MDDGFYTITYVGIAGMGLCVMLLENGTVRGFDMGGGRYDGTYTHDADGTLDLSAMLVITPGIEIVTGQPAQDQTFLLPVTARLPPDLDDNTIVSVSVGDRRVEATFKRMRGL